MKSDQGFKRTFLGIMVMLLLWNGFLTYRLWEVSEKKGSQASNSGDKVVEKVVTEFDTNVTDVVDKSQNKVVSVINEQQGQVAGSGSGVVYKNESGVVKIITNHHVVDKGTKFIVRFANGEEHEAQLLGSDPYTDLALLEIKADLDIEPFKMGDSSLTKVGEFSVAIGSPVGLEFANSVTFGIISGKDRVVPVDLNGDGVSDWDMVVLQTDAAINPGNSGGALVNMAGELIGINSMKLSSAQIEGMGFSIPINEVIPIINQIEENGKVTYPILGISAVSVQDLNPFQRNYYQIPQSIQSGVYIAELTQNGPAKKAGIKEGDILTEFDGDTMSSFKDFRRKLYGKKVGDKVNLKLARGSETYEVEVVLE